MQGSGFVLIDNIILSIKLWDMRIDDCQFKSIKKAELFLPLPSIAYE